jgi:hypothetical protein
MRTRTAAAEAIAAHGVVDVAALDVTTTKASGGGDVRVGASCAKAEVATVDEVGVGEPEIGGDRDGVQVSPRVPELETDPRAQCDEKSQAWKSSAARTCGVTASAGTGMRSGGRAKGSAGCRAGLLWKIERHREAQREGPGLA